MLTCAENPASNARFQVRHRAHLQAPLQQISDATLHGQIAEAAMLLRQCERRFHSLYDQHPDGVIFCNLDQRLTAVNPALCVMTGYAPQELLGAPLARLVRDEELQTIRERFADALHGKPQSCEFLCVRKDGSPLDACITLLPNLVDCRIIGVHGTVRQGFHQAHPGGRDDAAVVVAATAMAHSMSLKVVAEGVTSFDQMRFLQIHRCDELQGYLLCQPLPAPEAESFFKTCSLRGIRSSWAH